MTDTTSAAPNLLPYGPSALDGDVPVYLGSSALALVQALIGAQRAINSMKVEAETAAQGDEQMMLDACEQISNEGLEASLAIQAALSTAAEPQEELLEDASYESMNLAVMVLSDCGHSSDYTPLLERVAGRIDRHVERLLTAQRADLARRAQAEPAHPPAGWPRASISDSRIGWTLDYKFLEKVEQLAKSRTEYSTSMEATEQVLIAALEVLAVAPKAAPAAQGDALDAARYRLVRRGQHWSVIDGIGNDLRAEALDAAVDAARIAKEGGA